MKRPLTLFILVFLLIAPTLIIAQEEADSLKAQKKEIRKEKRSTRRWGWVPFPSVLYNTDIGLQFGALVNIFDYGPKRSLYPDFNHHFYAEVSFTTKGGSIFQDRKSVV